MNRFLKTFGVVLLQSGVAHSAGVARFYLTAGVPGANRVLLDIWVAEGLLLGGSLTSQHAPHLISRAPIHFVLLTAIYLLGSVLILTVAFTTERQRSREVTMHRRPPPAFGGTRPAQESSMALPPDDGLCPRSGPATTSIVTQRKMNLFGRK